MTASLKLEIHKKTGKARWVQVTASKGAEVPKGSRQPGDCVVMARKEHTVHAYCVLLSRILSVQPTSHPKHCSTTLVTHLCIPYASLVGFLWAPLH